MEACRTEGRIWNGTQAGTVVGDQGRRWCRRLLGGVGKMWKVILPQIYGFLPQHEYWLQSQTCPESRCFAWIKDIEKMLLICPASPTWFGLVAFLTGSPTAGAEEHCFKFSALTTMHSLFVQNTLKRWLDIPSSHIYLWEWLTGALTDKGYSFSRTKKKSFFA